ncbi:hypothetical protein TNCT_667131 [Trichonephila clavata]|uniref:Uncharacterized protein n=1 Tax=Trichonephila clavata TaxID=2740835 RepID=A0A8X6KVC0_TRICU|nr:hypothetical protein TNCT_667131 [Trichonephila clavata]
MTVNKGGRKTFGFAFALLEEKNICTKSYPQMNMQQLPQRRNKLPLIDTRKTGVCNALGIYELQGIRAACLPLPTQVKDPEAGRLCIGTLST